MLRYQFHDKKDRDFDLIITETGELREEEKECCDEIFGRAYRRVRETVRPYMDPQKCAAYRELSKRAVQLAWFFGANISIDVENDGEGIISLETDMFLLASNDRGDRKEYVQTLAKLFLAADDIYYFAWNNERPKIDFVFHLYGVTEQRAAL